MNWEIIGHEWAVELLKAHLERSEVRHAYLFTGPAGVGRRTLALRLAQALNCPNRNNHGDPCYTCRICRQIEAMQHADLFVVQAEKEGGTLKVDQIRELHYNLSLHPYEAGYKVALLLRFEEAHLSAMNALLKTLEEPGPQVILLLTADSPENLLPTVASRCEIIRLRPLHLDRLAAELQEKHALPEDTARLYAHISGGKPGYALQLARDPELIVTRNEWISGLVRLMDANLVERFQTADRLSKDKEKFRFMLAVWLTYWRDVLLITAGTKTPIANLDWGETIDQVARETELQQARKMVNLLERCVDLLDRNVNTRLIAEVLMLDLPHISIKTALV